MPRRPKGEGKEQERTTISLAELLTNQNPRAGEYARMIQEVRRATPAIQETEYAPLLVLELERDPQIRKYLDEKLRGQVLVDLGGWGENKARAMREFAKNLGIDTYIVVDRYFRREISNSLPDNPHAEVGDIVDQEFKGACSPVQGIIVNDDILDFVSRIKEGSVHIALSGIDYFTIPHNKYHQALAEEIARATKRGGIVFGLASDVLTDGYLEQTQQVQKPPIPISEFSPLRSDRLKIFERI